jgi:hypothetical protein
MIVDGSCGGRPTIEITGDAMMKCGHPFPKFKAEEDETRPLSRVD